MSISAEEGSTTQRQYEFLLNYMNEYGDIHLMNEGNAGKAKWIDLAKVLNSYGPRKNWKKWVKLWTVCKNRARSKAMILDGNNGMMTNLSMIEFRLMSFLGHKVVLEGQVDSLSQEQQLERFFNSPDRKAKVMAETEALQDEEVETALGQEPRTFCLTKIPFKRINDEWQTQTIYRDGENRSHEFLQENDIEDIDSLEDVGTPQEPPTETKKLVTRKRTLYFNVEEKRTVAKYNSDSDVIDRFIDFENRNIDVQFKKARNESRRLLEMQRQEQQHQGVEFVNYMRSAITSALIAYRDSI